MLLAIQIILRLWLKKNYLIKAIVVFVMIVTVNSCVESNPQTSSLVGINLSDINYYSSQLPFIDEFKSSHPWLTQNKNAWDTKESHLLDLDEQGWVKSLPNDASEAQYDRVSTDRKSVV